METGFVCDHCGADKWIEFDHSGDATDFTHSAHIMCDECEKETYIEYTTERDAPAQIVRSEPA